MNREIKFRAWDKITKKIKPVYQIQWDYKEVMFFDDSEELTEVKPNFGIDFASFDDCVLMQYTGLTDKNGKEIYEGDVVHCNNYARNYFVLFKDGCFNAYHADPKLNQMFWGYLYTAIERELDIQIIGNIYENPELLK